MFMDFVTLLVLAALGVLIVMNPGGFTQSFGAVSGYGLKQTKMFTGSGYGTSGYGS